MMTLLQSNVYLRNARLCARMLRENARNSDIFEGARLPPLARQRPTAKRVSIASAPAGHRCCR